jgi:5'-phosphate synthase pdxT subunit
MSPAEVYLLKIGVLALQGAFVEHEEKLNYLGAEAVQVRMPGQLEGLDGLVLPGGESTTIGKLLTSYRLLEPLERLGREGMPIFGTCAGLVLLSRQIEDGINGQPLLNLLDVTTRRNAFGRQVESFEAELNVPALGEATVRGIFIRAPLVSRVGQEVSILARYQGQVVAVQQGSLLATAFHPELSDDLRFHEYFLDVVRKRRCRDGQHGHN